MQDLPREMLGCVFWHLDRTSRALWRVADKRVAEAFDSDFEPGCTRWERALQAARDDHVAAFRHYMPTVGDPATDGAELQLAIIDGGAERVFACVQQSVPDFFERAPPSGFYLFFFDRWKQAYEHHERRKEALLARALAHGQLRAAARMLGVSIRDACAAARFCQLYARSIGTSAGDPMIAALRHDHQRSIDVFCASEPDWVEESFLEIAYYGSRAVIDRYLRGHSYATPATAAAIFPDVLRNMSRTAGADFLLELDPTLLERHAQPAQMHGILRSLLKQERTWRVLDLLEWFAAHGRVTAEAHDQLLGATFVTHPHFAAIVRWFAAHCRRSGAACPHYTRRSLERLAAASQCA